MSFQVSPHHHAGRVIENPDSVTTQKSVIILVMLIAAGFLGNYFTIPLFFGADFLFGSTAVLLVLYFYGLGWGILAAILVHGYTLVLWGHPYGFINFVSEALFVGIFLKTGRRNLLGLDGLFWLLLGAPLAWFYHGIVMHMDAVTASFIMLKQAINGTFNALLVSLAICYLPLDKIIRRPGFLPNITLEESIFNLLVMMVLFPSLLLTMLQIRHEKERLEAGVMSELQSLSTNVQLHLRSWHRFHVQAVQELADLAGQLSSETSPEKLQYETEILKRAFPDFHAMHVEDDQGCTITFYPRVNEKGESTLGLDFSSRTWFQKVKAEQRALVSDVFVGQVAIFSPIIALCVPVIRESQ
jgi:hypothetical protein